MKKAKQEDYGQSLQDSYDRWAHIYEHGGSDPFWEDGVNLSLVRNHILYYRGKIEETMLPDNYPAAYYKELPPEVDRNYMARADEIRAAAKAALARYTADPDYQYILRHYDDFTEKTREKLHIDNVISCVTGLKHFIQEDRLVDMRRHERGGYLEAFKSCADRMREAPPETVQLSMFSPVAGLQAEADDNESGEENSHGNDSDGDGSDGFDRDTDEGYDEPEAEIGGNVTAQNGIDTVQNGKDDKPEPTDISPDDNIPDELKSLNRWAVYRTYPDKETLKLKKVIISPVTSAFAHIDMPETLASCERAKAYAERYRYKGLVFALDKGIISKGITFIDIDHAVKNGEIVSPEAKRLLELLPDTYTEKSVSGTGIHILCKGSLPTDSYRRKDPIEMYDTRRFICMTGDTLNGSREIKDYSDRIAGIAYEFVGKRPPIKEYAVVPAAQSDTELINKISDSKQGIKFQALYRGDISAYPSHSHADSGLVFMLAWWTQDPAQIDRIFRSSGLMREKWDSRRGSGTYGSQLIDEALSAVSPREQKNQSEHY